MSVGINSRPAAAGFALAKLLRNAEFRAYLTRSGWAGGQHIIMAGDGEPFIEVFAKMLLHDTGPRVMVALEDEDSPFGFGLFTMTVTDETVPTDDVLTVAPSASVGMIFSYLRPRKWYVPHNMSRPFLLERAEAPA